MLPIRIADLKLSDVPTDENDEFEFKSSLTPIKELGNKLAKAVSGFANAGGGYFLAGVDDDGNADGGYDPMVGNQSLDDWLDTIIHKVEPTPKCDFSLIDDASGRGTIQSGRVVVALQVMESNVGPHMAPDKRYYIRAGRHTVQARHFIVEAVGAKRLISKPRLGHLIRLNPEDGSALQLCVLALTESPAIDVEIQVQPSPCELEDVRGRINVSLIDRQHPFAADIAFIDLEGIPRGWPGGHVWLKLRYHDLISNEYTHRIRLEIDRGIYAASGKKRQIADNVQSIRSVLERIADCLERAESE